MSDIQNFLPLAILSDSELIAYLHNNDDHQFPLGIINNLKFDKFNFIDDNTLDDHILHEPVCEYYFDDSLIKHKLPNQTLKLLSYNIASIPLHLDTFVDQCLDKNNTTFDVIGLCETRLNDAICSLYN